MAGNAPPSSRNTQEASASTSFSLPLFSPLGLQSDQGDPHHEVLLSGTSTDNGSVSLSPLTINARDTNIAEFTKRADKEIMTEPNWSSVDTTPSSNKETTPLLYPSNKENIVTPLYGTSTPSRSLRVRISARRLKEIRSPYSSDESFTPLDLATPTKAEQDPPLPLTRSRLRSSAPPPDVATVKVGGQIHPAPPLSPTVQQTPAASLTVHPAPPLNPNPPPPLDPKTPSAPPTAHPAPPINPKSPEATPRVHPVPLTTATAPRDVQPAPPPPGLSDLDCGQGTGFKDSVEADQRGVPALKQGIHHDLSLSCTSDSSIVVLYPSTSPSQEQKDSKTKLLEECRDHVGKGRRRAGRVAKQLGRRGPYKVHLIASSLATNCRNSNQPAAIQHTRDMEDAKGESGSPIRLPGEAGVCVKKDNKSNRTPPISPSMQPRTRNLDKDMTENDPVFVRDNIRGQEKSGLVGSTNIPDPIHSAPGQKKSGLLGSTNNPDPIHAAPGQEKSGQVGSTGGCGGGDGESAAHMIATCTAAATVAALKASSFMRNKPIDVFVGTVDQEIGIGDDSSCKNQQEFSTSCHNPQKSSPRKGRFSAEDERKYHRNEAAHIQDMLKRLQMLEELHHAQDVIGISTRPQLKPGNRTLPSTISYISNSRGSPATKTNRGAPATQGCSEDGPSSQIQHPWQDLKLRDEVPVARQEARNIRSTSGNGEQKILDPAGSLGSSHDQKVNAEIEAREMSPTSPDTHSSSSSESPRKKEEKTKFSQIQKILERVKLSQMEGNLKFCVDEMEDEDSNMGKLLHSLDTYGAPDEATSAKISAAISDYLSHLPPLSPSLPSHGNTPKNTKSFYDRGDEGRGRGGRHSAADSRKLKLSEKMDGKKKERLVSSQVSSYYQKKSVTAYRDEFRRHHQGVSQNLTPTLGKSGEDLSDWKPRPPTLSACNATRESGGGVIRDWKSRPPTLSTCNATRESGGGVAREYYPLHDCLQERAIPLKISSIPPSSMSMYFKNPTATSPGEGPPEDVYNRGMVGEFKRNTADVCLQTEIPYNPEKDDCGHRGGVKTGAFSHSLNRPQDAGEYQATATATTITASPDRQTFPCQTTPPPPPPLSPIHSCSTPSLSPRPIHLQAPHSPPPPPPSPPCTTPIHPRGGVLTELRPPESLSSEELDERIRVNLERKATDWVQRELVARMLSQINFPRDPIGGSHLPGSPSTPNSCSTCSPLPPENGGTGMSSLLGGDGLQVFVGEGVPVDEATVEQEVKSAVKNELYQFIRAFAGKEGSEGSANSSGCDQQSYTPLESNESMSSSSPVVVSTPDSTPNNSPTPSISQEFPSDVPTPKATPPPLMESVIIDDALSTPQASDSDATSSSHMITETAEYSPMQSTPSVTPNSSPPGMPEVITPEPTEETMPPPPEKPPSLPEFSLSASSSSDSTTAPSQNKSTTLSLSTTTATDQPISMGEFILKRHPPPPPPPMGLSNPTSLSEGEVPFSPGDARCYSLYTAQRKGTYDKDVESTLEAFLDLKNSPDPSSESDLSQFSDSLQSEPNIYSVGEFRKNKHGKPPEKLFSKFNLPNTETSATATTDNTLSELPSIDHDYTLPTIKLNGKKPYVSAQDRFSKYSTKTRPIMTAAGGYSSPGEVKGLSTNFNFTSQDCTQPVDTSISLPQSEGEVPAVIRKKLVKILDHRGAITPMEDASFSVTSNEVRDGIDVINLSRYNSSASEEAPSLKSNTNLIIVDPDPQVVPHSAQIRVTPVSSSPSEKDDKFSKNDKLLHKTESDFRSLPPLEVLEMEGEYDAAPPMVDTSVTMEQGERGQLEIRIPTGMGAVETTTNTKLNSHSNLTSSDFDFTSYSLSFSGID